MAIYDAVVIGGGCGGASAAFFLKRYSLGTEFSTLLIERLDERRFSKYHRMCGEAISKDALKDISPIKPKPILNRIKKVQEHWPGGITLESSAKGFVLDRPRFLGDVLRMYDYLEGERKEDAVVGIDQDESFVKLTCSSGDIVRGKRVIAADGPHSIVRREIFGEEPPLMTQAEQFVIRKKLEGDTIHFYQDERYRGGYRWEFPYGELAKVGFPRNTDDVDDDIIERHRRDIPSGGLHSIVKGRICLVGDAAAQANPLTGGGIRIAMLAGKRAARATVNNNLLDYEDWWRSCPFSSPRFIVAQKQMEKMTNDDFARALRPFKRGFSTIAYINAVVKMPQFRSLYAAYVRSGKVGW